MKKTISQMTQSIVAYFAGISGATYTGTIQRSETRGGNVLQKTSDARVLSWFNSRRKEYNLQNGTELSTVQFANIVVKEKSFESLLNRYAKGLDANGVNKKAGLLTVSLRSAFPDIVAKDSTFKQAELLHILKAAAKVYATAQKYVAPTKKVVVVKGKAKAKTVTVTAPLPASKPRQTKRQQVSQVVAV